MQIVLIRPCRGTHFTFPSLPVVLRNEQGVIGVFLLLFELVWEVHHPRPADASGENEIAIAEPAAPRFRGPDNSGRRWVDCLFPKGESGEL